MIEHRRPDLILIDKVKRTALVIYISIQGGNRVGEKELEKITNYQDIKWDIIRMLALKVEVVPVVVGTLGTVSRRLQAFMERIGIVITVETSQKSALRGKARIIRNVQIKSCFIMLKRHKRKGQRLSLSSTLPI